MPDITGYKKTALTGGTSDALDGIDGAGLLDGDFCFVMVDKERLYAYELDDDLAAAESSPHIIVPDSNPGTKCWTLLAAMDAGQSSPREYTIAAGVLNLPGPGYFLVDTEADAASDELTQITGLSVGDEVELVPANDARTVVIKNGTNLKLQRADFTLENQYDSIRLRCISTGVCREISRANCGT